MKTNKSILNTALAVLLATAFLPALVSAQETKTLHGHMPAAISRLHLKPTGQLPADTSLNLAIGLPLKNTAALSNLLEQVYDPSSPNYHHYLTPAEFNAQFGPSEEDYQSVVNFAKASGLTVVGSQANRMIVDVQGKASDIENAFQVTLLKYHHPTENRDFYAPDSDPTVSSGLPVLHVSGLDNYSVPRNYLHPRPVANSVSGNSSAQPAGALPVPSTSHSAAGTAPGGTYWGSDFRNAYVPGSPLTGTGQNVALLQFDGFFTNDIASYASQIGLTNPPQVVVIPVDGGVPNPDPGDAEPSLDIEMVMSMAPGVSTIYVYEGGGSWDDLIGRIASDDLAKQVSSSWGLLDGPPDPTAEQIYQEMALQGQSVFQASGDSDAYTGLIPFPSDSPYQTLVGGTTLTMNGRGVSYASETVWNWGIEYGDNGVGSGGGISTTYPIPAWQTNINVALCQGSPTMRNVPDVALTGDNVWVIYGGGQTGDFGGTSCAAPLWTGFAALINEQATNKDLPPVGFLNPLLYAIATNNAIYTNAFHDTITGNNTWSGSPTLFDAVTNYDLCTGLGTPNGTNLINALTTAATVTYFTHLSAPLPPYGTKMASLNGGNPNGNWYLFVQDNQVQNGGLISNGWSITLTTANPVGAIADDALTMTAAPTNLAVGLLSTISIGVTNYGPYTSTNVVVTDILPLGFNLVSSNATVGSVNVSGQTLTWTLGNLVNSAGAQLSFNLDPTVMGFGINEASVTANTPDVNTADNSAEVDLNVLQATPPEFSSLGLQNNQFRILFSSPAFPLVVQASTNLINWVDIETNTPPFIYTDSLISGYPHRFYRAFIQP